MFQSRDSNFPKANKNTLLNFPPKLSTSLAIGFNGFSVQGTGIGTSRH